MQTRRDSVSAGHDRWRGGCTIRWVERCRAEVPIDKAIKDNAIFCQSFHDGDLTAPPARHLMVITCMDARINVEAALGLKPGEAHILRNAGGSVTEDVLRSAIISTNLMGTTQIMVINHTRCGMMNSTDNELRRQFTKQYGKAVVAPNSFHTIDDLSLHAREQVAKLRDHPWIPEDTVIRGFTYDVQTGRLHEVKGG